MHICVLFNGSLNRILKETTKNCHKNILHVNQSKKKLDIHTYVVSSNRQCDIVVNDGKI